MKRHACVRSFCSCLTYLHVFARFTDFPEPRLTGTLKRVKRLIGRYSMLSFTSLQCWALILTNRYKRINISADFVFVVQYIRLNCMNKPNVTGSIAVEKLLLTGVNGIEWRLNRTVFSRSDYR